MKDGFTVKNKKNWKNDNCILVKNYSIANVVYNLPTMRMNKTIKKDQYSIGVWKIKSLKN